MRSDGAEEEIAPRALRVGESQLDEPSALLMQVHERPDLLGAARILRELDQETAAPIERRELRADQPIAEGILERRFDTVHADAGREVLDMKCDCRSAKALQRGHTRAGGRDEGDEKKSSE